MNQKKLLLITRNAWNNDLNTGNTASNFFGGYNTENIANVYCRYEPIKNNICKRYFRVSESDLINGLLKGKKNGVEINFNSFDEMQHSANGSNQAIIQKVAYENISKHRLVIFLWARELLWLISRWKSKTFKGFLKDFAPEIIYMPACDSPYMHRLLRWVQKQTGAKIVLFHTDDYLTENIKAKSLLAKINRKILIRTITKSALKADINYCISPKLLQEYAGKLNKDMKILYKGADFFEQPLYTRNSDKLIRLVYLGTTEYGRWKTLGLLADEIKKINSIKPAFELLIYSQFTPSDEKLKTMAIEGASKFMGKVPAEQVPDILNKADIVLHVESFELEEKLKTRLSFSTKIVDCLHSGRCIFAIGWDQAASIDYLIKNDAALVATNENSIAEVLQNILNDSSLLDKYADKAWDCGKRNHQIKNIQNRLYEEINAL